MAGVKKAKRYKLTFQPPQGHFIMADEPFGGHYYDVP
jgi:hypothetical protein